MASITNATWLFLLFLSVLSHATDQKFFGCIWQGTPKANFKRYFNQVTPENVGKWGNVNWNSLDAMYAYAEENDFLTKQHTFVWDQQAPGGVKSKEQVENWIKKYMERYGDKVDMIDVVNEALPGHAPAYYRGALGGDGDTGWDWVLWSFETTRKYAPHAKLLINDYGILHHMSGTKKYCGLIETLKAGGNLDGIGVQAHGLENIEVDTIRRNLDTLAKFELPIYVSEFELHIGNDDKHAERMKEMFPVFWEHPAVAGVTVWGYEQGRMWRSNGYLVRGDKERPGMTWLVNYLKENPLPVPQLPLAALRFSGNPSRSEQIARLILGMPEAHGRVYGLDGRVITSRFGRRPAIPLLLLKH